MSDEKIVIAKKELNISSPILGLIDHELCCLKMLESARNNIQKLGKLTSIEVLVSATVATGQNWSWWSDKERGGGLLGAVGTHIIDTILFTINPNQYDVRAVAAFLNTHYKQKLDPTTNTMKPVTSDDYTQLRLKLQKCNSNESKEEDIIPVNISTTLTYHGPSTRLFHFYGEEGNITMNWDTYHTVYYPARDPVTKQVPSPIDLAISSEQSPPKDYTGLQGNPFHVGTIYLAQLLYKELTERGSKMQQIKDICSDFESELLVQLICDLAHESNEKNGIWIQLDKKLLEI